MILELKNCTHIIWYRQIYEQNVKIIFETNYNSWWGHFSMITCYRNVKSFSTMKLGGATHLFTATPTIIPSKATLGIEVVTMLVFFFFWMKIFRCFICLLLSTRVGIVLICSAYIFLAPSIQPWKFGCYVHMDILSKWLIN